MQFKPKANCPMNAFQPCKEMDCSWFVCIRGKDPQSEKEIDEWACAISWLPVLLCENSQMSRQTGAAVESFRNEMVKSPVAAIAVRLLQNIPVMNQGSALITGKQ